MTTFAGAPVTLEGTRLKPGSIMPDFTVTDVNLAQIDPMKIEGTKIILSVPSADTPVCSAELAKFMHALEGTDVKLVSVSMDLPFALKRWMDMEQNDNLIATSDFKDRSFAKAAGVRMVENGLLARAVFVVNPAGEILYDEYVDEVTQEPDYDKALEAAGVKK